MFIRKITRRKLLLGAGGAATVAGGAGLWLGLSRAAELPYRKAVDRGGHFSPSVYLAVEPTNTVTIWVTKSEMGQGVSTALPMLIADEMDADWQQIRIEQAIEGPGFDYGNQFTVASSSITSEWIKLRRAGAVARSMLLAAAAEQWGVSASSCDVKNGIVYHPNSGQAANFGSLAQRAAKQWAPIRPRLKTPQEFTLIGNPMPRLDSPSKITGKAQYGTDLKLNGLKHAVIARPPAFGSKLVSFDASKTREIEGVEAVIKLSVGIAVVASTSWAAIQGRQQLLCEWQTPTGQLQSNESVAVELRKALDSSNAEVAFSSGGMQANPTALSISAQYELPFLAHMCMEPMNCTAAIIGQKCEIWAPTQAPEGARQVAAEITGFDLSNITVNVTQLGGGFGRRAAQDFVAEAVELAAEISGPVQVIWTREDDVRHALYREASAHRIQASLDPDTKLPSVWVHRTATAQHQLPPAGEIPLGPLMGAEDMPYECPNHQLEWVGVPSAIPTNIWRSVGYSYNTFAIEAFIDELAHAANADPLEFRLRWLGPGHGLAKCLQDVAGLSRWREHNGRHLGVAAHTFAGTHVAQVAEVEASETGFRTTNIWCSIDCGIVVNPNIVEAQVSGGIIDALSAAIYGELQFKDNAVQQSNFHDYPLLRINEVPDIEVSIISSERYPTGVGEASVPSTAPAVVNALFSLTGKRIRTLPLKSHTWSSSRRQTQPDKNIT